MIILDKFISASCCNLVLAVCKRGQDYQQFYSVSITHPMYMLLYYVLLFLFRDPGQHYNLQLYNYAQTCKQTQLEQQAFYQYYLYIWCYISPLFYTGCLLQQYIVNAYVAYKTIAFDQLQTYQQSICADVYTRLANALICKDVNIANLGYQFILLSSFTSSNCFMQQLFQDLIAIVQYFGKPSFFIMFIANLHQPEITENLLC